MKVLTRFDLGKIEIVLIMSDKVDFVEFGLVIFGDELMPERDKVVSDDSFGMVTIGMSGGGAERRWKRRMWGRESSSLFGEKFGDGAKTTAMLGGNSMVKECFAVFDGAVADVRFKTMMRIIIFKTRHVLITSNFGDDARGGDLFDEKIGTL